MRKGGQILRPTRFENVVRDPKKTNESGAVRKVGEHSGDGARDEHLALDTRIALQPVLGTK